MDITVFVNDANSAIIKIHLNVGVNTVTNTKEPMRCGVWIPLLLSLSSLIEYTNGHSFVPNSPIGKSSKEKLTSTSLVLSIPRGGVDDLEMAVDAFDWCANLGAPAALVGGAVLATLAGTREFLSPKRKDTRVRRLLKQSTRFLLLSAFGLEIISIFVTTVTGTMLLAHGDVPTGEHAGTEYHSPMGFLRFNHEFEYLTARITFLQGLFHWLIATALELTIPKEAEGEASKRMNQFIASSLITIVFLM